MKESSTELPAAEFVAKQWKLMNEENRTEEEAFELVLAEQQLEPGSKDNEGESLISLKKTFQDWVRAENEFWNAANEKFNSKPK